MTTLTEFLLERIAEDEVAARYGSGELIDLPESAWGKGVVIPNDPARVLAEVAAKRAIVEWCEIAGDEGMDADAWTIAKHILRQIAAIYADHPDYDEGWRP